MNLSFAKNQIQFTDYVAIKKPVTIYGAHLWYIFDEKKLTYHHCSYLKIEKRIMYICISGQYQVIKNENRILTLGDLYF